MAVETLLDRDFVARFARPPAPSRVEEAVSLHTNVRELFGEPFLTLLQGSYKNDTALFDIDDVDIVVVRSDARAETGLFAKGFDWPGLFSQLEQRLQDDRRYANKWERRDKCIRVNTGIKLDIVPAIVEGEATTDPFRIYSFREKAGRRSWPRTHYERSVDKNARTNGAYKPTVRLFKRWAKCHFPDRENARSYYIECLVHQVDDRVFSGDLPVDFVAVASAILTKYGDGFLDEVFWKLPRISGDGNLLDSSEWPLANFHTFRKTLLRTIADAAKALTEKNAPAAKAAWRRAFNGYDFG